MEKEIAFTEGQQATFSLLPGWLDVVAMNSSYQSAAVMERPFLNLDFLIFKFNLLTSSVAGLTDHRNQPGSKPSTLAVIAKTLPIKLKNLDQ